jgi:hypothetical protein
MRSPAARLKSPWGLPRSDPYAVNCDGKTWMAIPVAEPEAVLTAGPAGELRAAMQNDYATRAIRANSTAARWAGFSSL